MHILDIYSQALTALPELTSRPLKTVTLKDAALPQSPPASASRFQKVTQN
jgi:hypothetical protein